MEPILESIKSYPRAMRFYVYTIYEFVLEMKCKKVLSLGVQNGQAERAILLALGENDKNQSVVNGQLVSVDHKDRSSILDSTFQEYKKYWKFIQGDTTNPEIVQEVMSTLGEGEQFDFLLIDANHDYEYVKKDFENYSPLVRSQGVVFFHDTQNINSGAGKVFNEINWSQKFDCNWGLARSNFIVGMGICKKP